MPPFAVLIISTPLMSCLRPELSLTLGCRCTESRRQAREQETEGQEGTWERGQITHSCRKDAGSLHRHLKTAQNVRDLPHNVGAAPHPPSDRVRNGDVQNTARQHNPHRHEAGTMKSAGEEDSLEDAARFLHRKVKDRRDSSAVRKPCWCLFSVGLCRCEGAWGGFRSAGL